MRYTFHTKPFIFKSPIAQDKLFIIGTNLGWIPYTKKKFEEIENEWNQIQNSNIIQEETNKEYEVQSNSDPSKKYTVTKYPDGNFSCNCPGFKYRNTCKHIETIKNKNT